MHIVSGASVSSWASTGACIDTQVQVVHVSCGVGGWVGIPSIQRACIRSERPNEHQTNNFCLTNNFQLPSTVVSHTSPSLPKEGSGELTDQELCQHQDLGVTNQIPTLHYVRL